jgi:hypothetical protein
MGIVAAWRLHEQEVRTLLARNRRVATAWQRAGGPALAQAFVRAFHMPSTTIPGSVNGVPIGACIDRLCAVFSRYGSDALRADIARLRSRIPDIAGLTLAEVLAVFDVTVPLAQLP